MANGSSAQMDEMLEKLRSERLIKVFINDSPEPFLIQAALLATASDYFVKAMKNEHLGTGDVGVIRLRAEEEVCKLIIYWILTRKLPDQFSPDEMKYDDETMLLLVRCWIAGDEYLLPSFQNEIMLRLALAVDIHYCFSLEVAALAFHETNGDSPLRRIVTENISQALSDGLISISDLPILDGATEVASSFFQAHDSCFEGSVARERFENTSRKEFWETYMVKGGAVPRYFKDTDARI